MLIITVIKIVKRFSIRNKILNVYNIFDISVKFNRFVDYDLEQGQKEIAACTESRFFPLFATNFMYSLMYSLLKIAVSRILAKIIAKSFCP